MDNCNFYSPLTGNDDDDTYADVVRRPTHTPTSIINSVGEGSNARNGTIIKKKCLMTMTKDNDGGLGEVMQSQQTWKQ
jgi:hypothetical protein